MPDEDQRIARLEAEVDELRRLLSRTAARGQIENVFSRYMYYHNAFRDDLIVPLWVKPGTEGIRAQYTNSGVYSTYESVMAYHSDRPAPVGKLIHHYTTTPVIEVAADGGTAKGVWTLAGSESGLTDPDVAAEAPSFMYSPGDVRGKKVWAHWVAAKYAVDFLLQDGEWRIWKFRCYEILRTPFEENWISFAEKNAQAFDLDIMYFGEDGRPKFMPPADEPVRSQHFPYRVDRRQELAPEPPLPHDAFRETFL